MTYPADVFFDIETLINVAQPERILLLGDVQPDFLNEYRHQRSVINQDCEITHLRHHELDALNAQSARFDVGIAINLFEHLDKQQGQQVLSKLRDVLTAQYCICLPLGHETEEAAWQLNDLFSFALKRVNSYRSDNTEYGLFKYNISDYKKTPDWLNADNWANPQMWGKYWW